MMKPAKNKLHSFLQVAWCRILYGHVMIPFGNVKNGLVRDGTTYMCARCLWCENLHFIGRDKESE